MLLDTHKGVYWHLNEAAMTFVDELAKGVAVDDYVRAVAGQTGTDEARVRADHLQLLAEFRKAKLVTDGPA
ncbi:PqqD family protein [Cellulomonas sp. zg-ZUI222]|uniref:PqqD family protein n=1 Tax=Cellulomonas wangleii TaxID=2816956 RepID=A0ABX8D5L8_9CELL|nr:MULTISPECIES: PqqD family protein [Cellulomonas]MBO0901797.1 PqqD family protein [Cellulomonas sp. zg-ZUI22]MBO0922036.1 PqqD family protein [Cellulomonas wangleii]MBO0926246.1 PqqD family protein [Cellulomonas wangleii]QVI62752.1 PqqD family protein [Cellulomonas wangleii]